MTTGCPDEQDAPMGDAELPDGARSFAAFRAARTRFLEEMRVDFEIGRLEAAWDSSDSVDDATGGGTRRSKQTEPEGR